LVYRPLAAMRTELQGERQQNGVLRWETEHQPTESLERSRSKAMIRQIGYDANLRAETPHMLWMPWGRARRMPETNCREGPKGMQQWSENFGSWRRRVVSRGSEPFHRRLRRIKLDWLVQNQQFRFGKGGEFENIFSVCKPVRVLDQTGRASQRENIRHPALLQPNY
jgi:hypothetical protein